MAVCSKKDCPLEMTDATAENLHELMRVVSDIGDGDFRKGVDRVKYSIKWSVKVNKRSDQFSFIVMTIIVGAIVSGSVSAVWLGFKSLLAGGK